MGKTGRGAGAGVGDLWVNWEMGTGRSRDAYMSPHDVKACTHVDHDLNLH